MAKKVDAIELHDSNTLFVDRGKLEDDLIKGILTRYERVYECETLYVAFIEPTNRVEIEARLDGDDLKIIHLGSWTGWGVDKEERKRRKEREKAKSH